MLGLLPALALQCCCNSQGFLQAGLMFRVCNKGAAAYGCADMFLTGKLMQLLEQLQQGYSRLWFQNWHEPCSLMCRGCTAAQRLSTDCLV
jgi:uncharacterized protein YheU (UPF0270 family)